MFILNIITSPFDHCKGPGLEIKLFSYSTQLNVKFVLLINLKLLTIANSFLLNIAEDENFSADKKENTNYCWLFIFFSRENIMLSWNEHEKSFLRSGQFWVSFILLLHMQHMQYLHHYTEERLFYDMKYDICMYRFYCCRKGIVATTF